MITEKMEFEVVEKNKDSMEISFNEKGIAVALVGALLDNGVDAYWYEPHPLKPVFMLHLDADDAAKELKKAVKDLDQAWSDFSKELSAKL